MEALGSPLEVIAPVEFCVWEEVDFVVRQLNIYQFALSQVHVKGLFCIFILFFKQAPFSHVYLSLIGECIIY